MLFAILFGLHFGLQHSPVHGLEADLRSKLAYVKYESKEFDRIIHDTCAKYQTGVDKGESPIEWLDCYGPTQLRLAHVELMLDKVNADESFDEANFALWPTKFGTDVQFLDGFADIADEDPTSFGWCEVYRVGSHMVRCGRASQGGNRDWPAVRTYRLIDGRWHVMFNYDQGPPYGHAEFWRINGRVDPMKVVARTRDEPKNLTEPMSGPFLTWDQTWYLRGKGMKRGRRRLVPTPLAELDRLAGLAQHNRKSSFNKRVPSSLRTRLWHALRSFHHASYVSHSETRTEVECDTYKLGSWNDIGTPVLKFRKTPTGWRLSSANF